MCYLESGPSDGMGPGCIALALEYRGSGKARAFQIANNTNISHRVQASQASHTLTNGDLIIKILSRFIFPLQKDLENFNCKLSYTLVDV